MSDERMAKELLNEALAGEMPRKTARTMMASLPTRRSISWHRVPLIAACLIMALVAASFQMPVMARALTQVPFLGDHYASFLKGTGVDVVYQAGLVNELNKSVTQNGITLTVISAYSDASRGAIVYTLKSDNDAAIAELWGAGYPLERVSQTGRFGHINHGSQGQYIHEQNMILAMVDTAPLKGLFGKTVTLSLTSRLGTKWDVSFPVQTVPNELNSTVRVSKAFSDKGEQYAVDEVTFSPSATVVKYSFPANASGMYSTRWSVIDEDGKALIAMGGRHSGGSGSSSGKGEVRFAPTRSKTVKVLFEGRDLHQRHAASVDVKPGAQVSTPGGVLMVTGVTLGPAATEVAVKWRAETTLLKGDMELIDASGNRAKIVYMTRDGEITTLHYEHSPLVGPLKLEFERLHLHEAARIEVVEIKR